jgi:nitrite reductase/ring-hydroxylating ferredoxin subunit
MPQLEQQDEASNDSEQTRREFCGTACRALTVAALGGSVASLLQACGGGGSSSPTGTSGSFGGAALPSVNGTAVSGGVTVAVAAGSPLATVGGSALVRSSSGTFLVARTGQDSFTALTAICTHENCTITDVSNQAYVCPCHGSRFSQTGQVQNGPATRALRSFATRFAGDVVTITL